MWNRNTTSAVRVAAHAQGLCQGLLRARQPALVERGETHSDADPFRRKRAAAERAAQLERERELRGELETQRIAVRELEGEHTIREVGDGGRNENQVVVHFSRNTDPLTLTAVSADA